MKKQLRAMMLGAAALTGMGAFAATTGTLTVEEDAGFKMVHNWSQAVPASGNWGKLHARGAAGFYGSDAVYVVNNNDATIWKFTADGASQYISIAGKNTFDITFDQGGNLIWNAGAGGTAGAAKLYVLPAGKTDASEILTIETVWPSDLTKGRVDRMGRALGDVLSEDGGYIPLAINGLSQVVAYQIKGGEAAETFTSMTIEVNGKTGTLDTGCIAQPWGVTYEEQIELDDPATASYLYSHNGNPFANLGGAILGPNEDFDGWVAYPKNGAGSGYGFDWFLMGDETYFIFNAKVDQSAAWLNGDFKIVRASDNKVVATFGAGAQNDTGQTYNSITAVPSEDGKTVQIYTWSIISGAEMFTITAEGGEEPEPETHTVAIAGDMNGWSTTATSTSEIVDNCAEITIANWNANWEFKYLVDGAWYGNDNQALEPNTWYDAATGNNMKLEAASAGKGVKFTVAVDTKSFKFEYVDIAPEAPETCAVIGNLVAGNWDTTKVAPLTKISSYKFEGDVDMAGGYFSLCEKAAEAEGAWDQIGTRWGAESKDFELVKDTPARICLGENAFNMQSFPTYPVNVKFTVDFENMTVTVTQGTSGIENVDAAADAVEYFNLQGVRVANPQNGLYIRRQGNTTTKVLVK